MRAPRPFFVITCSSSPAILLNFGKASEPSVIIDDPNEHRPGFFIQHSVSIKIDIPSVFKPEDMSYLKESLAKRAAQDYGFLYEGWYKADSAFKKKIVVVNSIMVANKLVEEEVQHLKQIATDATSRAKHLEKGWSEANLKLVEQDRELEYLSPNFSKVRETSWPTPELIKDEGSDNESNEISSREDKPAKNEKNSEAE
ncbi:hypothetical protein FNV43_RR19387 [Rhamnella rubrinervis]|uniref:Uncharacterized protein n=1 Tax=Rhamnella rubrinervis TaxID=2594499 RepID=A0A8K0DTY3_9ROSA|nr:hypothetical protein FNV43_RR19387 [Rhamnella rubrinervis]